ncbi:MAG: c-type cytochrome [Gemmatimonadota bacterium]
MRTGPHSALLSPLLAAGIWLIAPSPGPAQWLELSVPARPAADAAAVEAGRRIYEERCWFCHGEEGDGDGPVAVYLWPRPRDFTAGSYKLRTTESGELPTDEDLFRTISLGIPGTAMPSWQSVLTAEERWQVISYIKTFAADLFEDEAFDPYQFVVEVGSPPGGRRDSLIARGRLVFDEADCWECHGAEGRGDGERAAELTDDWDLPVWPADVHLGWRFKGGLAVRDIYMRLSTGLDGTPMPSYSETITEEERWQLAYYIASVAEGPATDRAAGAVITARLAQGDLPSSPDDPAWEAAAEVWLPLTGQATFAPRWQIPAVTDLTVRAVYNAEEIALLLTWDDRFADTASVDSDAAVEAGWNADDTYPILYPEGLRVRGTYPDAAEILFPVRYDGGPILPHFVYGSPDQPVELLRWRADLANDRSAPLSLVQLRGSGVREPPQPASAEGPLATGDAMWRDGRWRLVIRRPLTAPQGSSDVHLRPGAFIPVAFHVWDGANGETGLKMALSSWYYLYLKEPASASSYLLVLFVIVGAAGLEVLLVRRMAHRAERGQLTGYGIEPMLSEEGREA